MPVARAALPHLELDVEEERLAALALLLVHPVLAEDLAARASSTVITRSRPGDGERVDVLADVVDAQDRRAALEGGDRGARRSRPRAGRRLRVAESLPQRALAREADEHRPAEREQHVEPPHELEVVLDRLAEADARVEADPLLADARPRPRRRAAPRGTPRPRRRRRRTAARPASSAARPACASGRDTRRDSATTPASSGSPRSAVTSLTSLAPRSSAARATAAFDVSIETGTSPPSASSTGTTRRSSSSAATPSEPGRVDSPPTSTIAAPSAIIRRAARDRVRRVEVDPAVGERVRRDVDHAHHRWAWKPLPIGWSHTWVL